MIAQKKAKDHNIYVIFGTKFDIPCQISRKKFRFFCNLFCFLCPSSLSYKAHNIFIFSIACSELEVNFMHKRRAAKPHHNQSQTYHNLATNSTTDPPRPKQILRSIEIYDFSLRKIQFRPLFLLQSAATDYTSLLVRFDWGHRF